MCVGDGTHSYFLAYLQIRPVQLNIGLAHSGGPASGLSAD